MWEGYYIILYYIILYYIILYYIISYLIILYYIILYYIILYYIILYYIILYYIILYHILLYYIILYYIILYYIILYYIILYYIIIYKEGMRSVKNEAITMEIRALKMALCGYNISWPKTKHWSLPFFKELTRIFHDLTTCSGSFHIAGMNGLNLLPNVVLIFYCHRNSLNKLEM